MRHALFLIPVLLSSAACSSKADYARETGIKDDPAATAMATPSTEPVAFTANDARDGGEREFAYTWPTEVSAQPALAKLLASGRDKILAQEKSEWSNALAESPPDCVSCRNRSYKMEWKVVADTPRFLSLSGDFSTYTGGAHGMYGRQSLVWDKQTKQAVDGVALFKSAQALEDALGAKLCAALNKEREKRRGEPVGPAGGPDDIGFDSCQHVKDATVLIGSSNGEYFDRIGIWFGPYVAGSYAEGAYELNFPAFDPKILSALKPEYFGAFGGQT